MSTAPATAGSQHEGTGARLRNLIISAMFGAVLLVPKLLHIRRNAQSWMAFRIFLGFAGAALVILPLSLWNSWLAGIAGLGMFLAAILLPPAQPHTVPKEKARELGALVIVNGGKYQPGNAAPTPVQLFVGAERIWALDSHFQPRADGERRQRLYEAGPGSGLPGPLRRSLLESQDAIKRALRAQAFDSAGTDSPRGA